MKIAIKRGNDRNLKVTVKDAAGAPINITGWNVRFTVKKTVTQTDAEAIINKLVTAHENAAGGITNIVINGADTDAQPVGNYAFDIRVRDNLGKEQSSDTGAFVLVQEITDEV